MFAATKQGPPSKETSASSSATLGPMPTLTKKAAAVLSAVNAEVRSLNAKGIQAKRVPPS